MSESKEPTSYELIDKDGKNWGEFKTAQEAAIYAAHKWPFEEQDEDRTGTGWDIAVVGSDSGLKPPYPFCRTPEKCAGKGYCPRDIACND